MMESVTSSPRLAGRQCMNMASGRACANSSSPTWNCVEGPLPLDQFLFLAHAGPHIRVDGVRACERLRGVVRDQQRGAGNRGQSLRLRHDIRIGRVALRAADGEIRAQPEAGQHQGMRHVIAVADEGHLAALQLAEMFAQRLRVPQRLAGVVEVAQGVDNRHRRPLGQPLDGGLLEDAGDDAVHPAVEVARDILQRLPDADRPVDEERVAAQLLDRQLERQPGAQRGFFKQQGDGLAIERVGVIARRLLDLGGEIEQVKQLIVGKIEIAEQV